MLNEDYRDWLTHEDIYNGMLKSVRETNEEEINKLVEDVRKVFKMDENPYDGFYEVADYVNCINIINTDFRHETCDSWIVYAVDILENRQLWVPYREGFEDCLRKVEEYIDDIFLWVADELYGEEEE